MNDVPGIKIFNYQNNQQMYAGYVISIIMAITTLITFVFAIIAVPISGAHAPDGGITYPYLETLQQFPRDYIWQYLALVLVVIYLIQFSIKWGIHFTGLMLSLADGTTKCTSNWRKKLSSNPARI